MLLHGKHRDGDGIGLVTERLHPRILAERKERKAISKRSPRILPQGFLDGVVLPVVTRLVVGARIIRYFCSKPRAFGIPPPIVRGKGGRYRLPVRVGIHLGSRRIRPNTPSDPDVFLTVHRTPSLWRHIDSTTCRHVVRSTRYYGLVGAKPSRPRHLADLRIYVSVTAIPIGHQRKVCCVYGCRHIWL